MIDINHLTKHFGDVVAVDDLTIHIPRGEIFGFIGPNGAGKTTTIKMIGGILLPTAGEVRICGIAMAENPEAAKRKIGFIPDRPYLYEKLTGIEFLKFIADLYRMDARDFQKKAHEQLELFALSDWSEELIESYSHGMKQRLIMASALMHEPEVIIVDEPMVGLDPLGIKLVKDIFKHLSQNGTTVFISTHTLQVAENMCHRVGILNKGVLIAIGSPEKLKQDMQDAAADLEDVFLKLTHPGMIGLKLPAAGEALPHGRSDGEFSP
jgi:ABC-2 type transport system ATP-binding protein